MSKSPVPNLPPISGIQDPQVRAYLQALTNAWQVRNGQVGDGSEKFLTVADLQNGINMLQNGGGGLLGGSRADITAPGVIAALIQSLADEIQQSRLWKLLGERIEQMEAPDWFKERFVTEIKREQIIRETAMRHVASDITTVTAALGGSVAGVRKEVNAVANSTNALAEEVTQAITQVGNNIAMVNNRVSSVSDQASATASSVSALQVQTSSAAASAQQAFDLASNVNGKVTGAYTVKFDANGYVTGAGLGIEGKGGSYTSEFTVRADRFSIGSPVNPSAQWDADVPFIVTTTPTTVGGVTYPVGVWLKMAMIADASITTAKIGAAMITSAKIAQAAVDSAHIKYLAVDTIHLKEGAVTFNVYQETWGPGAMVGEGQSIQLSSFSLPQADKARIVEIEYTPTVGPYIYQNKNWPLRIYLYRNNTLLDTRDVQSHTILSGAAPYVYEVEGAVIETDYDDWGIPTTKIVPLLGSQMIRKFRYIDFNCPAYAVEYRVVVEVLPAHKSFGMGTSGKQTFWVKYHKK